MGCSCGCGSRVETNASMQKHKIKKSQSKENNNLLDNVFFDYTFSNNLFNVEENIIIYTSEKFSKNYFNTLNSSSKETVENSTFKDKSIAITYSKGYKIDTPNQDKFFVIVDGDLEIFVLIDGHGPFGHKVAQYIEEFFFQQISNWKYKDNYSSGDYEHWIKDLFAECQFSLTNDVRFFPNFRLLILIVIYQEPVSPC